jgi:2-polyprenyl-3-methyl-5-hydroxy-6-metoxy-1,4-benzoquinol methylase
MKKSVKVETANPIALTSFDYLYPLGSIKDNSQNQKFNDKLYAKFPGDVLDLGCSGGGFVKNCLEDGFFAVGLEGNDYSLKHKRAEWATIPENLFCADITKPFSVYVDSRLPHQFKVITAWEVMEHIEEQDLAQLFANAAKHLSPEGVFIVSISNKASYFNREKKIDLHRIHQDETWWTKRIESAGFTRDIAAENYFGKDWVRNERKSFHFVLRKK